MEKIKCVIVDDEPLARKLLSDYVSKLEDMVLLHSFKSALELKSFLDSSSCDMIFLDINMPVLTGLDLVKNFKLNAFVVFTTAYPEYALDAFEYDAVDYLLKPIPFDRFLKSVDKVRAQMKISGNSEKADWILLKENKRLYQLASNNILYVQAYGDYVKVIGSDKNYLTKEKFSTFIKKLNSRFQQCHRSYVVNLDHVQYVEGNHLLLNDSNIPISNSFRTEFLSHYSQE